ncbi:hypothetical protein B0H16DRAFT_1741880 [Mycena metata]|uniref:Uncharacterized protein n=1 Tax=Mycena metata TaxID=1033252 RepID=A0AAD7H9B8_9AGAR|nr:hypothetical protein B0H16DRAFT_1741880 [Mycena metata]
MSSSCPGISVHLCSPLRRVWSSSRLLRFLGFLTPNLCGLPCPWCLVRGRALAAYAPRCLEGVYAPSFGRPSSWISTWEFETGSMMRASFTKLQTLRRAGARLELCKVVLHFTLTETRCQTLA